MVGANLHGGLVLGAFLPGGEAVAMSFAFLGRIEGRLCLYSQLTGVVPGYQSRGLGYQIKLLQRRFARAEGIDVIAWAFDPLQAGNAHFNLARLGASAGRYIENMYGERTDALNAGVPTDRLIAEWDTKAESDRLAPSSDAATTLPRLIDTGPSRRRGETVANLGADRHRIRHSGRAGSSSRSPPTLRGCGVSGPRWPSNGERRPPGIPDRLRRRLPCDPFHPG